MAKNKTLYNIFNAINSLKKKRFVSVSIIISLFLGLLLPILVICFGMAGLNFFSYSEIKDADKVILLNTPQETLKSNDMKYVEESINSIQELSAYESFQATTIANGKYNLSNIRSIDTNFLNFTNLSLVQGRWFDSNEMNSSLVCIVGKNFKRYYLRDTGLGEQINIFGSNFEVIAVTDELSYIDSVIIPSYCLERIKRSNRNPTYYIKVRNKEDILEDVKSIQSFIKQHFNINVNLELYNDIHKNDISKLYIYILILVCITGVVLVYSIINISNIILNKVDDDRKGLGIRLSLGASKSDIYFQNLIEMMILSLIASALALLSVYGIGSVLNTYLIGFSVISISVQVVVTSILICIGISFFLSTLVIRKITKISIIDIFK